MTTENTVTVYTVNETGLTEIRESVERFSKHTATDEAVYAYAADVEQSLNENGGMNSSFEIRAFHSKSDNPIVCSVSDAGWDIGESDS